MSPEPNEAVSAISKEKMAAFLAVHEPGVELTDLAVEYSGFGMACRQGITVRYGAPTNLPNHFFIKAVTDPVLGAFEPEVAESVKGVAGPLYSGEVRFYRDLRTKLSLEAPKVYGAEFDEQNNHFLLVIEDLRPRVAMFPTGADALSVETYANLLVTFAKLHAAGWKDPTLGSRAARNWLETPAKGAYVDFLRGNREFLRQQMDEPYKRTVLKDWTADQVENAFNAMLKHDEQEHLTLLHSDPHVANLYLLKDGNVGLLDWQVVRSGHWAQDIAMSMVSCLTIEDRRQHERDLLKYYLAEREKLSVKPTDENTAWDDYRRHMVWPFMEWLQTPVPIHSEEAVVTQLQRQVAALEDLDTLALLK